MLQPSSPAYPVCVELAEALKAGGREAMNVRWAAYVAERAAAKKPVVLWEQSAMADTVRGLSGL